MALGLGRGAWDRAAAAGPRLRSPRPGLPRVSGGWRSFPSAGPGRGAADLALSRGAVARGRGVPRGDRGRRKDAGRAEPPLHAPRGPAAQPPARPAQNLRPPAPGAHLDRRPPPPRAARVPPPAGGPALPAPALTCTARLGHGPGGGLRRRCARSSRLPAQSRPPSRLRPRADSERRAPRPRPARRGRRHRSRRRLAAPSRSLKGAERRPRRPPRAAGEGLAEEGAQRRPRGPALQPGAAAAAPTRSAPSPGRARRRGDTAVRAEMGTRTGSRGREPRRLGTRDTSGAETPTGEGERNSEQTRFPGTWRVTESREERQRGRRDLGRAPGKPRGRWLQGSEASWTLHQPPVQGIVF